MIFRQLFDSTSCTYTYLLACARTKEAVLIDPVLECVGRDAKLIRELDLRLVYALNTHIHADHVSGSGTLKRPEYFPAAHSALGARTDARADRYLHHGEKLRFGAGIELEARSTPGHTDGCLTYVSHQHRMAFTGDALLVRGCGRTDFQGGSAHTLYKSIHEQIFSLPEDFHVYPAHDYKGYTSSTVGEEKQWNPRLAVGIGVEEFVAIMHRLKLDVPKKIDVAVPANKLCGIQELMDEELLKKVFSNNKE